jgi:hypothetical protein
MANEPEVHHARGAWCARVLAARAHELSELLYAAVREAERRREAA